MTSDLPCPFLTYYPSFPDTNDKVGMVVWFGDRVSLQGLRDSSRSVGMTRGAVGMTSPGVFLSGKGNVFTSPPRLIVRDFVLHLLPGEAGLFDRAFFFDGGDVAGVLIEGDGLEHAAHDLAAAGFR